MQPRTQRRGNSKYREERISMAVLKSPPKQPKTTVVQLRLDEEARMKLAKYAEFLDSSPSYVVTEALKLVYRKDKDFQSWLSGQRTKTSEPTSRTVSKGASLKEESFNWN
jgi:predicted transcriptional regulator